MFAATRPRAWPSHTAPPPSPPSLRQVFLSSLFASCLDFLGKDDVAAADAVIMQAFDVMVGNGCGGSSSSRVAVIECMRVRCCSPSVSICPHIQVLRRARVCATSALVLITQPHFTKFFNAVFTPGCHHTLYSGNLAPVPLHEVILVICF